MVSNLVKELLRHLPASPGVYLMRNTRGEILYVGKAANLSHRVKSHFTSPGKLTPKTLALIEHIHDFEYFVVSSEQEALILELNLIKRHQPPYNVLLKDGKNFPYLRIDKLEDWPVLRITRRLEEGRHNLYFGPFANAHSVHQTLNVLKRIFPLRTCDKPITGKDQRPCLKYHLGYCLAPCVGKTSRDEYNRVIEQVTLFLEGKHEKITRDIKQKMAQASASLNFEQAARFRDQLKAIRDVMEAQHLAMTVKGDQDAVAFATEGDQACAQVFIIRNGKLIGRENFVLKGTESKEPTEIMTSFIQLFYSSAPYVPKMILLQYPIEDADVVEKWLSQKREVRVHLEVPQRGKKKELIDQVFNNAHQGLELLKIKQLSLPAAMTGALTEICQELNLPRIPARMEGYDISNIQGTDAVGSMVVFEDGKPRPSFYRRFKIKTVAGANDYAMLQEMLYRRFKRALNHSHDSEAWAVMPDLVLIDGGKGQLNAASRVMQELGLQTLPLASLAKENEELFLPGRVAPLILAKSSLGLKLLQRLRDEAHRFAISYFQKVHKKRTFTSALDNLPGIGPHRKRALLKEFGSIQNIKKATLQELTTVKGITTHLAQTLKDSLP